MIGPFVIAEKKKHTQKQQQQQQQTRQKPDHNLVGVLNIVFLELFSIHSSLDGFVQVSKICVMEVFVRTLIVNHLYPLFSSQLSNHTKFCPDCKGLCYFFVFIVLIMDPKQHGYFFTNIIGTIPLFNRSVPLFCYLLCKQPLNCTVRRSGFSLAADGLSIFFYNY